MFIGIITAIIVFAMDQAHKFYMVETLELKTGSVDRITSFFNIVMVWNKGVSFGMLGGEALGKYQPIILMLFTLFVVGILLQILRKTSVNLEKVGLGMIIGGALGNAADRLHWGAVADFFDFHVNNWHWPAFNIADIFICLGVAIFIYTNILGFRKDSKPKEQVNEQS